MKAHKINITDPEHLGCHWTGPAPFEIQAVASTMRDWPEGPVVVHVAAGTEPHRAAALLREIAAALDRNGKKWLPALPENPTHPCDEVLDYSEKVAARGYLVDLVQYRDDDLPDPGDGPDVCRYPATAVRTGYSPTVSLQVVANSSPKQVLAILAEITAFLKADIKKRGAEAFAGPNPPRPTAGFSDDDEVPF